MPATQPDITLSSAFAQLVQHISTSLADQQLIQVVVSKNKAKATGEHQLAERIQIRPVVIKQQVMLSFVYRYKTHDITKNYALPDAITALAAQLHAGFRHVHVTTVEAHYQLVINKKNNPVLHHHHTRPALTTAAGTVQPAPIPTADSGQSPQGSNPARPHLPHNRAKQRHLAQDRPFLNLLGITDAQARIIPAMARKWKQINKFIEIFDGALGQAGLEQQETISVVDFGSGKGYLTFAVHDYLQQHRCKQPRVTGVELRGELVDFCNQAARQIAAGDIAFFQGDVRHYDPGQLDVMIALHACDIATDFALHTGIRLGAAVIMCAPCCHKEIRPQLKLPPVLQPMLQHGVHLGQQAEMLTDSLRALWLEAHGYTTKVFEFIALEHTSKNKMILAVKKPAAADAPHCHRQQQVLQKIEQLKQYYGIEQHTLEQLLS